MRKLLTSGLLAGMFLALAGTSGRAVNQPAINKAIDRGVKALVQMQGEDGSWPNAPIGATALAGLTLLECGVKPDDEAVVLAAAAVRRASLTLNHIYSISLAILFFDRLGEPRDVPLIEALTVRLLSAQTASGGWNYHSPQVSDTEGMRLQSRINGTRKLDIGRELPRAAGAKRSFKDLPREIQQQIALLDRQGGAAQTIRSDNSNTQFATMALWVARRHGLPVDQALRRVEARFRTSQQPDGGWGYALEREMMDAAFAASTASMTCAGLLGLAVADGKTVETTRELKPSAKPAHDINKDAQVRRGLLTLSTAIGRPRDAADRRAAGPASVPQVGGRTYYYLWSLERVAVALDLKTIGKKDWYAWGAEILVANQQANGGWVGSYSSCGADTCFALLFLKRANLVSDLTTQLTGRVQDPGPRVIKKEPLVGSIVIDKGLASGLESRDSKHATDGEYPKELDKKAEPQPIKKPLSEPPASEKPHADTAPERPDEAETQEDKPTTERSPLSATARMAADLVKSTGSRHGLLLQHIREGKGAEFTEALSFAIPQMKGEKQKKARAALVERLGRMKDTTLSAYLTDEHAEIRRAAALAGASKGSKSLVPLLIPLLRDSSSAVCEAAHQALKELSGQDFGPAADATEQERVEASRQWLAWWNKRESGEEKKR